MPDFDYSLSALLPALAAHRSAGRRIVFTNGVFDLLHRGHAGYLAAAKALGDVLVVGINSDASVRRLKGPERPLLPEGDRAYLVSMLKPVDAVVLFDEDTPARLIENIRPDVLVKGADYAFEEIVGHDIVLGYGGRVERIPLISGCSTSGIIQTILDRYGGNQEQG